MLTFELLEDTSEPTDPFAAIKAMNKEFKDLAAELDLTLVAGMGWPQIGAEGGWFGGGLGPKGGKRNEDPDKGRIRLDIRRKGFLHLLAKKLEDYIAAGRVVMVAAGAERSKHKEEVKAGEARAKLEAAAIDNMPPGNVTAPLMPCVAWYVSQPASMAGTIAVRFTGRFYGPPDPNDPEEIERRSKGHSMKYNPKGSMAVDCGGTMTIEKAKRFDLDFRNFKRAHSGEQYWNGRASVTPITGETEKFRKMRNALGAYLGKVTGQECPQPVAYAYMDVSRKVLPMSSMRIDMEDFDQFLRQHI
jgi:hypothetical protein